MRYEISNPHDECFVFAETDDIAIASVLLLGTGRYGLCDSNGKTILPVLVFGGGQEWIAERFDDFSGYVTQNVSDICKCLRSLSYANERTSLTDMKQQALDVAECLENKYGA